MHEVFYKFNLIGKVEIQCDEIERFMSKKKGLKTIIQQQRSENSHGKYSYRARVKSVSFFFCFNALSRKAFNFSVTCATERDSI